MLIQLQVWLLDQCGMDPHAGARPMRRLVRRWIEDAVADYLISHRGEDSADLMVELSEGVPVVKARDPVPQSLENP